MDCTRRSFLKTAGVGAATLGLPSPLLAAGKKKPNVLFIAVDDLRPQLGCHGHKQMISPNIDRLASEGVTFLRSYCQVPVCGASRASLLTGMRPTPNRFLGYATWAEKDLPGALSVAEHFKNNGYDTISDRYRYTQWRGEDGGVYARMLYDHKVDLAENVNIAEKPQNKELVERLSNMLRELDS